jgi:hypothetical protein
MCIREQVIRECRGKKQRQVFAYSSKIDPLYSARSDLEISDAARNDSELVKSLFRARTTEEIKITLINASPSFNAKNTKVSPVYVNGKKKTGEDEVYMDTVSTQLSCLSLNATAAALRRMAHISSVYETRSGVGSSHKYISNEKMNATIMPDQKAMITNLLEAIGEKLTSRRSNLAQSRSQQTSNLQELPDVFPLSDILIALAVLANDDTTAEKMRPFAILVVEFLNSHETSDLYKLRPINLVQCLRAMAKLNIDHPSLYIKICRRLAKGDALSKIPTRYIAHGVSAIASLQTAKAGEHYDIDVIKETDMDTIRVLKAFMRRLRKPEVREDASVDDMIRALVATRDMSEQGALTAIESEAAMFGFAILDTILKKRKCTEDIHKILSSTTPASTTPASTKQSLTPTQITQMISSWASLSDKGRKDTIIGELLQIWTDDKILEECSVGHLERIIHSLHRLDAANNVEATTTKVMRRVGERLLTLVEDNKSSNFESLHPDFAVEVLRLPVFLHRRNTMVMEPFVKSSCLLFGSDSFLERSSVKEISNFLWFLSIVQRFDEEVLLTIGKCLLKEEMVDDCSPNIASRILATFMSLLLVEENNSSESLMEMKQELFYSYGGHLLSSKLSPVEISSALYAYAKANYVQDKGVFDHLVNLLASSREKCSSRQLSQAIWSCGKMIAWERQDVELLEDKDSEMEEPPYLENAIKIAEELSGRAKELSPTDIAQIIWGIGRLEIHNDELISVFANRTIQISSSMNSAEVDNVLWGIAKVQYRDGKLIGSLSERLAADDIRISSPRAASSILFSLGRLQWKDEIVFRKLSKTMIDHIQDVNAQSVANTLYAFRAVRIRPPRELLNSWAMIRLGIVPAIRLGSVPVNEEEIPD